MPQSGIDFYLVSTAGAFRKLDAARTYVIGRDINADIPIEDSTASRRHCRLAWDSDGMWTVEDMGSANGTRINGDKLRDVHQLQDGDVLRIGNCQYVYSVLPANADTANPGNTILSRAACAETLNLQGGSRSPTEAVASISGSLLDTSFKELLLYMAVTGKTGVLLFDGAGADREIRFDAGTPCHACCDGTTGMDAIRELAASDLRGYEFLETAEAPEVRTITGTAEKVLFKLFGPDDGGVDEVDLDKAGDLQQHMLRRLPEIPGYTVGTYYRGYAKVSGDFYDVGMLPDGRILFVLGDASGHGVQAAIVVAGLLKTLRLLRRQYSDVATLLIELNEEVRQDLLPSQFCTCFAAALAPESGAMEVFLAGHHGALLADGDGVREVGTNSLAMGLFPRPTFVKKIKSSRVELHPGDLLVQFSDGLIEARNAAGQEFGTERVMTELAGHRTDPDLQTLAAALAAAGEAFADTLEDDLTILALRRDP